MGKKLSDLAEATVVALTDIFHLRTAGAVDKKITGANLTVPRIKETNGEVLRVKIIEIGNWDMDADTWAFVPHGLSNWEKVRTISALIRNDTIPEHHSFISLDSAAGAAIHQRIYIDSTNISLRRDFEGFFDNTDYDLVPYNRGWITVWYVE